jgi:hypothetical protein
MDIGRVEISKGSSLGLNILACYSPKSIAGYNIYKRICAWLLRIEIDSEAIC